MVTKVGRHRPVATGRLPGCLEEVAHYASLHARHDADAKHLTAEIDPWATAYDARTSREALPAGTQLAGRSHEG